MHFSIHGSLIINRGLDRMQTEPNVKIDQPGAAAEDFEVIQAEIQNRKYGG